MRAHESELEHTEPAAHDAAEAPAVQFSPSATLQSAELMGLAPEASQESMSPAAAQAAALRDASAIPAVQRRAAPGAVGQQAAGEVAAEGVRGAGGPLPHLAQIQRSFGEHDVTGVGAHVGGAAADASSALGAQAYATGNDVAFHDAPDLHTAAHEAAHVVQQRGGVQMKGGMGQAGDVYEQNADAVADAVVRGESAAPLLGQFAGGAGGPSGVVQRKPDVDAGTKPGSPKRPKIVLAKRATRRSPLPAASRCGAKEREAARMAS